MEDGARDTVNITEYYVIIVSIYILGSIEFILNN